MHVPQRTTVVQGAVASAIPIVAAAWLVTVPTILTASSFLAIVGVVAGFGWVAGRTYVNSQPAASLAQQFHDADHITSPTHPRRSN